MQTYYFDTKDGIPVRDHAGIELASDGAAIAHSKQLANAIRANRPADETDLHIVVIDRSGREIHREPVYPARA